MREAIEQYLFTERCRALRAQLMPYAEAQGIFSGSVTPEPETWFGLRLIMGLLGWFAVSRSSGIPPLIKQRRNAAAKGFDCPAG